MKKQVYSKEKEILSYINVTSVARVSMINGHQSSHGPTTLGASSYKFKEGISQRVGLRNGLYNRGKHALLD